MQHEGALRSTLKQLLLQRNVKTVKQLIALHEIPGQFSHLPFLCILLDFMVCGIGAFLQLMRGNVFDFETDAL